MNLLMVPMQLQYIIYMLIFSHNANTTATSVFNEVDRMYVTYEMKESNIHSVDVHCIIISLCC